MKEIKKLTDADLKKQLDEKRKALLDLRFNMSGTGKRNDKDVTNLKKEVARMLTEQNLRKQK